jgi:hypothetical protein
MYFLSETKLNSGVAQDLNLNLTFYSVEKGECESGFEKNVASFNANGIAFALQPCSDFHAGWQRDFGGEVGTEG